MAVDYKLEGHVAVVTGSTSGIGQALATALAEQGVNVVLNGLGDPAKIEADRQALQARTNSAVRYHPADMTKPEEIKDLIAFAVGEFGRLDILVNNAGIQHVAPVDEFPEEKWDALIAVILSSTFHASRAAIPVMKAQGRGRII
ncbi:MAG: SDR family NAD(P)-dependent oxidoreductase, partial [Phenylobacterium sp.]|nr:SDR family NAD(P)-dependent oxidoreductase [Phenylobacterium sp.]